MKQAAVYPDEVYRMALASIRGMSIELLRQMEETFGSAEEIFNAGERRIASVLGGNHAMFSDNSLQTVLTAAHEEYSWATGNNVKILTYRNPAYPKRLLDCPDAPPVLYAVGDTDLNTRHVIAMVGTRHATTYGMAFIRNFMEDLSQKIPDALIISGLAYGIDVSAHREAMTSGLLTAGVVAHGLSTIYPAVHRDVASRMIKSGGAILSDYRHDATIHKGNFLARNRIVAGLSDAVIVVESAVKGGAIATARLAAGYDRDVFAVPGRATDIYSGGCNRLIYKNAATILTSADDLIEAMGWTAVHKEEGHQETLMIELNAESQRVLDYLTHNGETAMNRLSVDLNMPVTRLIQLLGEMEFNGLILNLPGGRYGAIRQ